MNTDLPYIVADIGGTNARFGLVSPLIQSSTKEPGQLLVKQQRKYPSSSFDGIKQAAECYIESLNGIAISGACLAVAGPVTGDDVLLTNLDWQFSINRIKQELNLNKLIVMNDFAAYASATPHIDADHIIEINQGQPISHCPIAVVGPGTGFGVASVLKYKDTHIVTACEGGHMNLAPKDAVQQQILEVLSGNFAHISIESLLSGPGLANLYQALALVEGQKKPPLKPSEITHNALQDENSFSARVLSLFCRWLGQACGDIALAQGAQGGVYLGGGILLRFQQFLQQSEFLEGFIDKGQLRSYLSSIPIKLVIESNSALIGAAYHYQQSE
jgi:glucokinase